ncbi:unnamed protein product [Rotaria sp. Silwood2]|nr:unnamed protein product [Rotaria sp. Silwood2]
MFVLLIILLFYPSIVISDSLPYAEWAHYHMLEGTYRLNIPTPLLGYSRDKLSPGKLETTRVTSPTSVLRMFITMEPLLAPPESVQQSFDSTESLELLNHARFWVTDLNKKFPNRDYKATVSDINGRSVFIPRFLRPLPLPQLGLTAAAAAGGGADNQMQCQQLARFVSLIPFLSDTVIFPGLCDIWETSDQFLHTMSGDDEEHAVLLNNYFLTLNKNSWIAIGVSIYSGPCCFVLTKEDGQRYPTCWSVADGRDASTIDTWNPIRSIYLLANQENIWANIQEQDIPSRMNFDVGKAADWRPFFSHSFPRDTLPWTSVQPNDLHYEDTRSDDAEILSKEISHILRNKMIDWREANATSWHHVCQKHLEEIIKRKEMEFIRGSTINGADIEPELADFQKTHNITGFALQMPYTTVQAIVDTVYSTNIFKHATNEIKFALAVHVHPYPNNILAVWIYIAHLTPK